MSIRTFSLCFCVTILLLNPVPVPAQTPSSATEAKQFDRSQPRTWTDANGNKQEATFAGVLGQVVLLKVGGNTIRIELSKFSKEDLGWIAEVLRREGRINQLPAQYRDYQPAPAAEASPTGTPAGVGSGSQPESAPASPLSSDGPSAATESPAAGSSPAMPANGSTPAPVTDSPVGSVTEYREWEDNTGQKLKAKFQSVIGDDVLFKPETGAITRVPFKNLSPSDQKLLRDYHESKGMLERLPREFRAPMDLNALPADNASPAAAGTNSAGVTPYEKLKVIRTWKDNDGKELVARFWNLSGDQITLQDEIRMATYGLATLSHDDLEWFQEAMREAGRMSELPLPYRDPADRKKSDLDLVRHRRTGYYRKWTSFTGKTMVGMFDRFIEEGKVRIVDNNGNPIEFPYTDFSEEDQTYLRERLEREIPGEFFPEKAPLAGTNPPEGNETFVWTDLEGRQLNARFVKLDRNGTVVVLDAGAGEVSYFRAFLDEEAEKKIKGITESRNALARANAEAARSQFQQRIGSGSPGMFSPPEGRGMSPGYSDPPAIPDPLANLPAVPEFQPPPMPPIPTVVWTYKCETCGTEFGEDSGLKQGDKCPVCTKKKGTTQYIVGAVVLVIVGLRLWMRFR